MKYIMCSVMLFVVLLAPVVVFADAPGSALGTIDAAGLSTIGMKQPTTGDYTTGTGIASKITNVINWFSWGVALVAVVMGLYAGFLFITARGEAAQLKTARGTLLWAVIGIAVAVLAFSIIAITKSIFTL